MLKEEIRKEDLVKNTTKKGEEKMTKDEKENFKKEALKGFAISFTMSFIGGMLIGIASAVNKK